MVAGHHDVPGGDLEYVGGGGAGRGTPTPVSNDDLSESNRPRRVPQTAGQAKAAASGSKRGGKSRGAPAAYRVPLQDEELEQSDTGSQDVEETKIGGSVSISIANESAGGVEGSDDDYVASEVDQIDIHDNDFVEGRDDNAEGGEDDNEVEESGIDGGMEVDKSDNEDQPTDANSEMGDTDGMCSNFSHYPRLRISLNCSGCRT